MIASFEAMRQQLRQGAVFRCLQLNCEDATPFRVLPHLLQKNGLANAAQADHQNALCRAPALYARDGDAHLLAQVVAGGKFRGRGPGTRGIRILDWFHGKAFIALNVFYKQTIIIQNFL